MLPRPPLFMILLLATLIPAFAGAQGHTAAGTIVGKVYLAGSRTPLPRVTVAAVSPQVTARQHARCGGPRIPRGQSRGDGSFVINGLAEGIFDVVATRFGYITSSVSNVAIDSTGIALVTFHMRETRAPRGAVSGVVLDAECGHPLEHARAFLDGTDFSTRTGNDGTFMFDGVPQGTYRLLVHPPAGGVQESETLMVAGDVTTDLAVHVPSRFSDEVVDYTGERSDWCHVHRRTMTRILVPVGYGLRAHRKEGIRAMVRLFPFAEPLQDGGCVVRSAFKTWDFRCPDCIAARNRWIVDASWTDLDSSAAGGLVAYEVPAVMSLRAPPGLTAVHETEYCDYTGVLESDSVRVEYHFGPRAGNPSPARDDLRIGDIVDGCFARINISMSPRPDTRLPYVVGAYIRATPDTLDGLSVAVRFADRSRRREALAIVRSIDLRAGTGAGVKAVR